MTSKDDDISTIAPGRQKEIAEEFDRRLSQWDTTDQACKHLGDKYSLTKEQVMRIVREHRQLDKDPDPDGGRVA